MTPIYVPVVQALVVGAAIFALLAIGASMTYRLAWHPEADDRHVEAVLLGAKIYASVGTILLGSAISVAGFGLGGAFG